MEERIGARLPCATCRYFVAPAGGENGWGRCHDQSKVILTIRGDPISAPPEVHAAYSCSNHTGPFSLQ